MEKPLVGIIMGSQSDLNIMGAAADVLDEFGIANEVTAISAHRAPKLMINYASKVASRGFKVIIAGAGGAAHLPGLMAAMTTLPVIGVPIKSSNSIDGLDSLFSIVQMPEGVPVATVAINGARNAGILAAQIIGTYDNKIAAKLKVHKENLQKKVQASVKAIAGKGHRSLRGLSSS
jgi:5-(carboxyamino)imidazole ribonucleotide mutase